MSQGAFKINGMQLLSLSLKLAFQACKIVKSSYMNKNVKNYLKAQNDPVTEADFKIQSMLVKGFKMHYPNLKIIGEQQKQYQGHIQTDYNKLHSIQLPKKVNFPIQYENSQSCLWIDPIDNTKGFIKGQIQAVTNLIGLSYSKKAELGIIGIPFKKNKNKVYYNPSVLFGCVSGAFTYEYFPLEERWVQIHSQTAQRERIRLTMSAYRQNKLENIIANKLNAQKILAGGSGYKMALVGKKQAQIMAYCFSHSQKWDTCAGQAVVKSMKGWCTTKNGDQIIYNPQIHKQYNKQGVICTSNQQLHKSVINICKQYQNEHKTLKESNKK